MTPSTPTGEALIARLEAAEVGSRELDREVHFALDLVKPPRPGFSVNVQPVTTSLDAALALAERLFPAGEWLVIVNPNHGSSGFSYAGLETAHAKVNVARPGKAPALALCLAILKATGAAQ